MLKAAFLSFLIALVSSALSYGDVAAGAVDIAIILFFGFPIVTLVSLSGRRMLHNDKMTTISVFQPAIATVK